MKYAYLSAVALMLAACGTTATQQATLTAGAQTLAQIAAAKNTSVAAMVTKGALFCQRVDVMAPITVALANAAGAPVIVTNQAADAVARACAAISAVPVAPPADPASAVVVAAPVALPPA